MASGCGPCNPDRGGTSPASRQPQSKTNKDISLDRQVAPACSSSGMPRRESSLELLGVDWPEPQERVAQCVRWHCLFSRNVLQWEALKNSPEAAGGSTGRLASSGVRGNSSHSKQPVTGN